MDKPPSPTAFVEPVRKGDSLHERIYNDLRAGLQRGKFAAGHRLVDIDVAATYGTSRMPAREALLQLVHEGYLVGTTRGFAVPSLSLADIADIFEVRRLLEPRAAAHAARDLSPEAETELGRALAEARQAMAENDIDRMIRANIAFRGVWLAAVRNRRLATTIARFVDHVQTVRLSTLRSQETQRVVVEGLEQLYEAFVRRDSLAAFDRMTSFMAAAERAFFTARTVELADEESSGKRRRRPR